MSTVRKIAKNTLFLFLGEIVSKISLFLLIMFIARRLGGTELGKYSFAFAFGLFFFILTNFGLDTLIRRNIARDKINTSKYVNNSFLIKNILSIVSFFLMVLIINLINYPSETRLIVYIFGASLLVTAIANTLRNVFYAFEEMQYELLIKVIETVSTSILGLLLIFAGYGLFEISIVFLITSIISLLLSVMIVQKKFVKLKIVLDIEFCKFLLKEAWPFLLDIIFWIIYLKTDILMLSILKGDAIVGWFSASYQIIDGLMFIPAVFIGAVFPVMSRFFMTNKESLKIAYEKSSKYLLILVLPIAFGVLFLSQRFIYLIYGKEFTNSIVILQIFSIILIFMFMSSPLSRILVVIEKQREIMKIGFFIAILNIILNFILIPFLSYIGAAISSLICLITMFLWYYLILPSDYRFNLAKMLIKPLIAVIIMSFLIIIFYKLNLFLLIFLSGVIYIIIICILKVFKKDDIKLFKELGIYKTK